MEVFVKCTLNNTLVSAEGRKSSAGKLGFKGSKRGGLIAAEMIGIGLGEYLREQGVQEVKVNLKGILQQGFAVLKGLRKRGIEVLKIQDCTPLPHNGCRLPKRRRV